jgi:hypothetical protein
MRQLFRAMKEDDSGSCLIGDGARMLGIRPGVDVTAKDANDLVYPGQGGLSISPDDPLNLPYFRRPQEFQGIGKDPVWLILDTDLPGFDLCHRPDPAKPTHGFIEPVRPMTLGEYKRAIARTHTLWRKLSPSTEEASNLHDN